MILDFNKRDSWNKRGGAKFGPFLINVVAEITELWVGNSQKINCRDVTSIREGRVICMTETIKSSMHRAVQVTKSEANKILEVFCL